MWFACIKGFEIALRLSRLHEIWLAHPDLKETSETEQIIQRQCGEYRIQWADHWHAHVAVPLREVAESISQTASSHKVFLGFRGCRSVL